MPKKPQKPQHGQPAIKALYDSICDVIDYLPSLEVKGDQKSTYVTKSSAGTVIHANQPTIFAPKKGNEYLAGSGLQLSGTQFNVNVDNTTIKIINNTLSCTVTGGGAGDHYYNYDNVDGSIRFYSNTISEYPNNHINYIGINPDWLAGYGQCPQGYHSILSAILKAFSGTNQSDPWAIGSQSIQTYGTEVWVNPYWLAGYTSCQGGFYGVCSAVYRYLNALPVDNNGDTLKKGGTMGFYWGVDQTGGGGGGGGGDDTVYKYADPFGSIYFSSNDSSPASNPVANNICVNVSWLAGLTECKAGAEAVQYAVASGLAALPHNATSCVLHINPTTSGLYWDEDIGANQNFLISTGLTSATVYDPNTSVAIGTSVALNSTYKSYLDSIGNKTSNTILSCQNGNLVWATNTAGGGGYDGNDWYKYRAMNDSLIFYPSNSNHNGTTEVSFNPDWLAGNGYGCCCYQGPAAVASAILKLMTNPVFAGFSAQFITLIKNGLQQ